MKALRFLDIFKNNSTPIYGSICSENSTNHYKLIKDLNTSILQINHLKLMID